MMDTSLLDDRDLLVLSDVYSNFVKHQVDRLAEQVEHVTVLVRYNRLADVAEYIPIDRLEGHKASSRVDRTDQPANVTVETVPLLYLPIDYHYEQLGEKFLRQVRKRVDISTFDLVHAHFTWPCGYAAANLDEDLPSVLTVHENEEWLRELSENGSPKVTETWRDTDAIVRVNEKDVAFLKQFNDSVYSIPNGYSPTEFPPIAPSDARDALGLDSETDVVFGLGALKDRKRWRDLVMAMETVETERESVSCAIAGHGPNKGRLNRLIEARGLTDVVDVLGFIPQSELTLWMNAADIFVLPSEAEGNPTVMFEALGCGTPYIGTNVGGVPEIVTSEEYGLLCDPGDVDELARNILRGLEREWDRSAIREYAEQYTWDVIVERLVNEVFTEVLTRKTASELP